MPLLCKEMTSICILNFAKRYLLLREQGYKDGLIQNFYMESRPFKQQKWIVVLVSVDNK